MYITCRVVFLKAKKSLLENHSFVSAWQTASNFRFTRSLNHKGHAKIPFLFSSPKNSQSFWPEFYFFSLFFYIFTHFLRMINWRKKKKCWKLFLFISMNKKRKWEKSWIITPTALNSRKKYFWCCCRPHYIIIHALQQ